MGAINGALGDLKGQELISFSKGTSLSLAPQLSYGSEGFSIGANLNFGFNFKGFNAGLTAGVNYYENNYAVDGSRNSGLEGRIGGGFDITGKAWGKSLGIGLSTMAYANNGFSQTMNTLGVNFLGTKIKYENDYMFGIPISDKGDRFRTAALTIGNKDVYAGFNLYTGDPNIAVGDRPSDVINGQKYYFKGTANNFRLGAAFVGYKGYRLGRNSEGIRNIIQNKVAHTRLSNPDVPYFPVLQDIKRSIYYRIGTSNHYSLW